MAKDPAFLFYPGDWMGGTSTFTRAHKGAYMDLLMAQHNNGHLSIQDIEIVLGSDFEEMWESKLKSKFIQDDNGLYFNKKLKEVMEKRRVFTKSREKNLKGKKPHKDKHMESQVDNHMENENENRNIIKDREEIFKSEVEKFKNYPAYILKEFFEYWSEQNPSGKKMRFELEKTWDLKRRLSRWSANSVLKAPVSKKQPEEKRIGKPMNQKEVIEYYKKHGYYPNQ